MYKLKTLLKITTIIVGGLIASFIPVTIPFVAFIVPAICEFIDATFQEIHNLVALDEAIDVDHMAYDDNVSTVTDDNGLDLSGYSYILLED